MVKSRNARSSEGSRSCNSGSVPFFRLDSPPAPFFSLSFLPLYFTRSRRGKGVRPARFRPLIFLLNCS